MSTPQVLELRPHPTQNQFFHSPPQVHFSCDLQDEYYHLHFDLQWWIVRPDIHAQSFGGGPASRRDELWRALCFEVFFVHANGAYFEFNGDLHGSYNLYQFESYRQGMKEVFPDQRQVLSFAEGAATEILSPFLRRVKRSDRSLQVEWWLPKNWVKLKNIDPTFFRPSMVMPCVGEKSDQKEVTVLYYSTIHEREKPDFHALTQEMH